MSYNAWPLGQIPKEKQRPEIDLLREKGYPIDDPRDAVELFEKVMARFTGSKYAVSVDCCSNGLFLCLKYLEANGTITLPSKTYVSVPMQIIHAGCKIKFDDFKWYGRYQLKPYSVWDCALEFSDGMHDPLCMFEVMSFQIKKTLPIGRGGMILTDDLNAYKWLKKSVYDGRDLETRYDEDEFSHLGWHCYMTPEDAARGLLLFEDVNRENNPCIENPYKHYTDLSKRKVFKSHLGEV
tara:strand:- start:1269 stop:1982 length:714 start_codon:yes stop_codon:yes gene_type:complete